MSDLVERLGRGRAAGGVRDALASALRDPTLELAYWLPEPRRYVDASGRPVELPDSDGRRRAVTEIEHDGRRAAAIVHDAGLLEQPELVRAAGAAAALALENERLDAELRARCEELRASRARLVAASDAARRRIERDLHDGAQQRFVALALTLRRARSRVDDDSPVAQLLDRGPEELDAGLAELREPARGIHPAVLSERGLAPALEWLATASAGRTRPRAQGCAASPTAWRRSTGACGSRARRAAGRSCAPRSPSADASRCTPTPATTSATPASSPADGTWASTAIPRSSPPSAGGCS